MKANKDVYYGSGQTGEAKPTVAKNATIAQSQQEEKKELAVIAAQNQMAQAVGQETNQVAVSAQKIFNSAQTSSSRSISNQSNQIGKTKPAVIQHDSSKTQYQQANQPQTVVKDNIAPGNALGLVSDQQEQLGLTQQTKTENSLEKNKQTLFEHYNKQDCEYDRQKGILGAHNIKSFKAVIQAVGGRITNVQSVGIPGLRNIEYRLPQRIPGGKRTGIEYNRKFTKTVYDPSGEQNFIKHALEAITNATPVRPGKINSWIGCDSRGVRWQIYKTKEGNILTAFPII